MGNEQPVDSDAEKQRGTAVHGNLPDPQELPQLNSSPPETIRGWRLAVITTASFVGFFMSLLDTTIVSVALPSISNHFNDFDRSTWVINAYLISYMGFAIIISRLSDIFGRKTMEVTCFILFIAFSIGCALSQSMTQLIVFRALQGAGGCGLYSMCLVIAMTMTPRESRSMLAAYTSICVVTAGILGPLLGGAITLRRDSTTFPIIFWINLPLGVVALVAMLIAWPSDKSKKTFTWAALSKVDFLGSLLLLAASALLVFALQEAGSYQYAWNSTTIVACLVVASVSFIAFALWQYWIAAHPNLSIKVVFPINLMKNRVIFGAIVSMFLSGFVYFVAVVNLPERFQIVSGSSPIIAGVRLLPMLVCSAIGSLVGGALSSQHNLTAPILVTSAAFQVLGYGLMTTIGDSRSIPAKLYGFEVFLGLGFGLGIVSVTRMMEMQVEPEWMAVTQGALAQMRTLGGSVGLAIAVIIFNSQAKSSETLKAALSPSQANSLFQSPQVIETFTPTQQALVAEVFGEAFTGQMRAATYAAAACFVFSLLTLQRHPPPARR